MQRICWSNEGSLESGQALSISRGKRRGSGEFQTAGQDDLAAQRVAMKNHKLGEESLFRALTQVGSKAV